MTPPPEPVPPRRVTPLTLALFAAVLAGGLWLGDRLGGQADGGEVAAARAASRDLGAGAGVAALSVRTLAGDILPLDGAGEPTVVMVVSRTCGVCKEALRDFGRMAAGRPLGRLRIVTLEGAAEGVPMVSAADVRGALLAGPVTPAAEALFAFQIRGTPTFVALDARGRVRRVVPGYPGREAFRPWVDVMLGDRDAL